MVQYHKIFTLKDSYFLKEYETIKHHKNKIRFLREETVAQAFKAGNVQIILHFEETGRIIELDDFSDVDLIKKYLGPKFLTH